MAFRGVKPLELGNFDLYTLNSGGERVEHRVEPWRHQLPGVFQEVVKRQEDIHEGIIHPAGATRGFSVPSQGLLSIF